MIEYLPWSRLELEKACAKYIRKHFSILDIELGGGCNMNCVYCDSPNRDISFESEYAVSSLIASGMFSWLFICGLGEPSFDSNKQALKRLLYLCKSFGVKCSIFSNLLNFDDELFSLVDEEVLNVMFKLDSFSKKTVMDTYGVSAYTADKQISRVRQMKQMVHIRNGCSNLCASIVPTKNNYNDLRSLVEYCLSNNIFPLIGDLEDSGSGQNVYEALKISELELSKFKQDCLPNYILPICPSVLCGIHILHDGSVALDESTGLSCHWFWLKEPQIKKLGKIQQYSDIYQLETAILDYRSSKLLNVKNILQASQHSVFGGCGGDVVDLLSLYLSLEKE